MPVGALNRQSKNVEKPGSFWKFHDVVVQNNGKEMYKKVCCTCKVAFLLIRPIVVFSPFSLPLPLALHDFIFCLSKL